MHRQLFQVANMRDCQVPPFVQQFGACRLVQEAAQLTKMLFQQLGPDEEAPWITLMAAAQMP